MFEKLMDMISAEDYVTEAEGWMALGARLVGDYSTGPEHVRMLKERLPARVLSGD